MERKPLESKNDLEEENGHQVEENVNNSHRPFLSRLYSKTTPIGFQYHQVYVPPWNGPPLTKAYCRQQLSKRDISIRPQPTFLASRVKPDELENFLNFVQSYYQQKISDYFTTGTVSRERTRGKAMDFLHQMDYNYVKAKFYILFPYYLTYNTYRCHDPLNISLQDMQKKIKDHLDGLKNTKQKDMQKWIESLEASLTNRTSYQKFITLVDQGKQNKYQMPQHIKQHIQKAQKMGRQLKKSLQGNKLTIEALRSKRTLLDEHKLMTLDMVAFEDTVVRCQEWIKKQFIFQQKYIDKSNGEFNLKNPNQKIEFKQLQMLVNQYSNLPLSCPQFQTTTKSIYLKTTELLENIPNISKIVKTRNSKQITITKIPHKQMKDYLKAIQNHIVWHEDFLNFQVSMRQSLQLIERMNMYLEDPLSEKNSKTLNNYIKLMSDVQIENNVEKRLRNRQECNDIIERIKKQISNPGKVQSIKESFIKLKEKGIKQVEDLVYQEKILMYIGWHQSQERLKQVKPNLSNIQIIEKELYLRQKLVNVVEYRAQLQSAKKQWNITEDLIQQATNRLQKNQEHLLMIRNILSDPNPNLQNMISVLKECISFGLMFPELWQLHDQIVKYFVYLAKIHTLLKMRPQNLDEEVEKRFFFTRAESDHIIEIIVYPEEIRILKTKEKAEQLLRQIQQGSFPKYLQQCRAFQQFMRKGELWAERVRELIKNFTQLGDSIDIKQLEDARYFIHSKAIKQEIGKIQTIMRWRQKIAKKLDDGRPPLFQQEEQQFLQQLEKDLNNLEINPPFTHNQPPSPSLNAANGTNGTSNSPSNFKQLFLEYSREHDHKIKKILNLIVNESKVENSCKLSEMNKFHREIEKQNERHKIDDKKILQLKQKFRDEIVAADQWKQKYLIIKRFEKKKLGKKDEALQVQVYNEDALGLNDDRQGREAQNINEVNIQGNNISQVRKKHTIKNGQFTWYFKFLIMILQFSKGYKLKFCLEQLLKLKNSLTQIEKFLCHYDKVFQKPEPFDSELTNLDTEATKIQIFIREIWLLKKKLAYVNSWRIIADSILQSVQIVNMELKARKPEELLTVLANRKQQTEEANKQTVEEKNVEPNPLKRERKPNSYYFTSDITLYPEENLNSKPKKKKKGNNGDGQYRNTAVASQAKKNARSQIEQIQRTEAIIKASVEAGALCEDPKEYCICRYGQPNQNTTMVQCDAKCEEWYHIQCIGIKKHQAKGQNRYTCVGCSSLYGLKSQGAFYWDYHSKISEYALEEIVIQGKNLGVFTHQLKKINIVYEKMKSWKANVNELITNILRDDFLGKQISSYKEKLYQAYLLSLWLPTYHYETFSLKKLLFISRGEELEEVYH